MYMTTLCAAAPQVLCNSGGGAAAAIVVQAAPLLLQAAGVEDTAALLPIVRLAAWSAFSVCGDKPLGLAKTVVVSTSDEPASHVMSSANTWQCTNNTCKSEAC